MEPERPSWVPTWQALWDLADKYRDCADWYRSRGFYEMADKADKRMFRVIEAAQLIDPRT